MKAFILKTLASLSLFGLENHLDVTPSTSSHENQKRADLSIDYRLIKEGKGSYYFLNPRSTIALSGEFSSSLGIGLRKELGLAYAGVYFFANYSYVKETSHFQMGPCLEYINPSLHATVNYYFPVSHFQRVNDHIIKALHSVDGSVFYKSTYVDVGIEPSYSWGTSKLGMIGHITIPTRLGNINLSAGTNFCYGDHAKIGISFPVYGQPKSIYASKIRRETGVVYDVQSSPKEIEIKQEESPCPIIEPDRQEEKEPYEEQKEECEEQIKEEWSLWEFLFGWLIPDEGAFEDCFYWPDFDFSSYNDDYYISSSCQIVVDPATPDSLSNSSSSVSEHDYSADVDSSHSSEVSSPEAADATPNSDSAFLDSIADSLAAEGGYSISVDSPSDGGLADLFSPDSMQSIETGCSSDSSHSGYEMVTPNPSSSP